MTFTLIVVPEFGGARALPGLDLDRLRAEMRALPRDGSCQVYVFSSAPLPLGADGTLTVRNQRIPLLEEPAAAPPPADGRWGRPEPAEPLPRD